jgi:hypothetical protein
MPYPTEPYRNVRKKLLTAAVATWLVGPLAAHAEPGALTVTSIDSLTGRRLEGVRIEVTDRDGNARAAVTGSDGTALFDGLEEGFYRVEAQAIDQALSIEPTFRVIARRTSVLEMEIVAAPPAKADIEEVTVVATLRGREADPFGAVTGTFRNRDELRSAVGAGPDVMRALDGLPGLASDGAFAAFTVRGRGPRNNLIFVDDFPLDKVVHFDATIGEEEDITGGGRFSIFAPNSVAGAEFSPGGWSAAYGGRSGSLLRLDLAEGGPTPITTLRLDIAGAEFTYDGPSGFDEDTSVYFTARQFDFGNVFELIGQEDIGTPEVNDFILKTSTQLGDRDELQFLAIHAPEKFTRDVGNVAESDNFEDTSLVSAEQDLSLFGLTWRRLVGETGEWTNRLYYRSSDKDSSEGEAFPDAVPPGSPAADYPVRNPIFSIREKEEELGWRSDYRTLNRFGTFTAGLRAVQFDANFATALDGPWVRYVYETDDPRPEGQQYIVWEPENFTSSYDESALNLSAYVEQAFEVGRFDVRPGVRVDDDDFSDETYVSPRLSIGYNASPDLRFSLTSGLFYESPRLLTRASAPQNFGLKNEEITHFGLGMDYRFADHWRFIAEAYYQELDDLVVDESRATGRAGNQGDGTNRGFDLVLQRAFDNGWSADMTYSYNDGSQDDNDGRGSYTPDFSREHFFAVGGRWEITDRLQVAARWKWGSGRPGDAFIIHDDVLPGSGLFRASKEITAQNVDTLGDFQSLNIRIDYRRPIGSVDLVTFFDIVNVYGAESGAPAEFNPRNGQLVEDDGGLFPLIGIIFEKAW